MNSEEVKKIIDEEIAPLSRKIDKLQIAIDELRNTSHSIKELQEIIEDIKNKLNDLSAEYAVEDEEADEEKGAAIKIKITTLRDENMEQLAGVKVEACTAFLDSKGALHILGEIVSSNKKPIRDYRELQVVVFDSNGDISNRELTIWNNFGLRQSFDFKIEAEELAGSTPAKVKVYPATD